MYNLLLTILLIICCDCDCNFHATNQKPIQHNVFDHSSGDV